MSPPKPRSLLSTAPAVRLAQLMELYAPMTETGEVDDDGEPICAPDPTQGIITREQFLQLVEGDAS